MKKKQGKTFIRRSNKKIILRNILIGLLLVLLLAAVALSRTNVVRPGSQNFQPDSDGLDLGFFQIQANEPEWRIREADRMEMVLIPAGVFIMGSNQGFPDEQPVHEVYLDDYWIDRYLVSNAQFVQFIAASGYLTDAEKRGYSFIFDQNWVEVKGANWQQPQGPDSSITGRMNYPVVHVSWNDAQAYCQWAGARLPSEAEWEKAARGTDGRIFPWGDEPPDEYLLNFNANVGDVTAVGQYPAGAGPYGTLDMAGNVWEWVQDWYGMDYYHFSERENPTGAAEGDARVLKGGSWINSAGNVRAASRGKYAPDQSFAYFGFRCAASEQDQ